MRPGIARGRSLPRTRTVPPMPSFDWIGKQHVINHHKDVAFRFLKQNEKRSRAQGENLLIEGDNLDALKSLMPRYRGRVNCVYIDPPYNTGNEGWSYNDNVASPQIKKWLGKVVDLEDLSRHDKWLCMMYPRLVLLRELLCPNGIMFVSIDDNEQQNLKQILNMVFGEQNFIATLVWNKKNSRSNDARHVSTNHEYVMVYCKKGDGEFRLNRIPRSEEQDSKYKNPDGDRRGPWITTALHAKSGKEKNNYEVTFPNGIKWKPPTGTYVRVSKERLLEMYGDNRIWFGKGGDNVPRYKRFLSEMCEGIITNTLLLPDDAGTTQQAKSDLRNVIKDVKFDNPKPVKLIKYLCRLATQKDDTVLDSFAGSGTTAQAVMELNAEDGGSRKFILVEQEPAIARKVTCKRVARVAARGGGDWLYILHGRQRAVRQERAN